MAALRWPDYAVIDAAEMEIGSDVDVIRTPFESGAIRQARRGRGATTWRITAHLESDAVMSRFQTWAREGHKPFDWTDPLNGGRRRVRLREGASAITYEAAVAGGRRRWIARMLLEEADT